ncbi:cytochrome P450 [Endogone sp. FLAS-F59071]|nr:cytochrome P450 [Endogone sp. FLAS-F59071]|eukprot:RUS21088.1 cytochrome P450 [Endogone sp. FLAS-F59071]
MASPSILETLSQYAPPLNGTGSLASTSLLQSLSSAHLLENRGSVAAAAITSIVVGLLLWEQLSYRRKKKDLPGPNVKLPLIGALLESLYPTFEGYLSKWNSGPLSCVSVFDRFIVIASTCDLSRKILNSPVYTEPCVVDSMRKILESDNWIFLMGKAHSDYRKGLNVLFTRKALRIYVPIQLNVYAKHFEQWLQFGGKPVQYQMLFREVNMETSLKVFFGSYIPDDVAAQISIKYLRITAALELVNFPLALPGTKVWHAMQSRKYIVNQFTKAIKICRERMARDEPELCMLDAWVKSMIAVTSNKNNGEEKETRTTRNFSDREIALTLLTFLFASQDATTSAVTWAFQLLADHPDVLAKVRQEQEEIRDGDYQKELTYDMLEKMGYTRQVVKEVLRLRPPVLMIPYQTKKEYPISPEYTVPKGAMVIPTFWPALHDPDIYPNPDKFNPDRFGPNGDASDIAKNYMVFGCGPHHCLGKEYAIGVIMSLIAQASIKLNWEHVTTKDSEKITIFATTYPTDACTLKVTPRDNIAA